MINIFYFQCFIPVINLVNLFYSSGMTNHHVPVGTATNLRMVSNFCWLIKMDIGEVKKFCP